MSRAKDKGTAFETDVAKFLSEKLGCEVRRNPLMASLDQGDLMGVEFCGKHFCIECKAEKAYKLSEWMGELEREMPYAETNVGCVVFKRKGFGEANMGRQFVLMDLDILARLLKGRDFANSDVFIEARIKREYDERIDRLMNALHEQTELISWLRKRKEGEDAGRESE